MAIMQEIINTLWKENTEKLKDRLLTLLAKYSYIEGKIILASGKESNYYVDCKLTTLHPEGGALVSVLFLRMLKENINAVGGLSVGVCPLASGVSQIGYLLGKNIDALYVRKEPKKHGTSKWIEGQVRANLKVSILEDVVTTGGSSLKAIEKISEFGCKIEQILSIVDRNDGGREIFKKRGLDYSYIFDINEIIERSRNLR